MAIAHDKRLALHQAMREVIGVGPADTLMECIPFDGWDHFARVEHVELATARTEARLAEIQRDLEANIVDVRTELKDDIRSLRDELKSDIASLREEMHRGFANQNRWMAGYMLTFIIGLLVATVR